MVIVEEPNVVVEGGRVVVMGSSVPRETETVGCGWIVAVCGVEKKTGAIVVELDEVIGTPLEYSGIWEGGAVATLAGRVICTAEGFTLCTGVTTALLGSREWTVTGHQAMAVVVMAGMEMVVVIVWMPPPAAEDSKVVVSGGHRIVVVEPICEGGSTRVQGGIHEAALPPPGAQIDVGT
jgi:hypothetical protein